MDERIGRLLVPLISGCVAGASSAALAGDLGPPAGAVTSTMKTLEEVEPRVPIDLEHTPGDADSVFRIAQAGSYYLTGEVVGEVGKHGIEIDALGEITIDLRGFAVRGVAGSLDGIVNPGGGAVSVVNGHVRDFDGDGVDLGGFGCAARDLVVQGNGDAGLRIGSAARAHNVASLFNSGDGIRMAGGAMDGCTAEQNGGVGIHATSVSTVTDCRASLSGDDDFQAIQDVVFERCVSLGATARGFDVLSSCTLRSCTVESAGLDGIYAGDSCLIESCVARGNGSSDPQDDAIGIRAGGESTIRACTATGTALDGVGIYLAGRGVIERCIASGNGSNGIAGDVVADGLTVIECQALTNGTNGILVRGGPAIGCTASGNGISGISVTGDGCIVENCRASGNMSFGIEVLGTAAVVRGCTAANNTGVGILFTDSFSGGFAVDCMASGNGTSGITMSEGGAVRSCIVRLNQAYGIAIANACRVEGCTVSDNVLAGIFANAACSIVNNTCTNNAVGQEFPFANILHLSASEFARVEGNNVAGGDAGITATGGIGLVIRNTVSDCTVPYNITCAAGPIIDISVIDDLTMIANADHPWANFQH